MSKAVRTALSLVVTLVLFSALTTAQPRGNNGNKDKNKEHHNAFAKLAFCRHHKDANKNAKQAQATRAPSKRAQAKTAQLKPATAKQAGKKDQKLEQHASNASKASAKKAPAAHKTKLPEKAHDPKTASLKQ